MEVIKRKLRSKVKQIADCVTGASNNLPGEYKKSFVEEASRDNVISCRSVQGALRQLGLTTRSCEHRVHNYLCMVCGEIITK